ncbi:hypothetical protein TNIN_48211 [Trichonephila inaurata madagascariensis]|uniref:Uncharacterized protein n=1 Tax=Trichonephila inaurata madagascariensis TaxID=2747483 RepID=A0A8X6YL74_9ARAC|nr:hypothetical protein TNIN_48211 [Trichonephila inaurata madagascariensis]
MSLLEKRNTYNHWKEEEDTHNPIENNSFTSKKHPDVFLGKKIHQKRIDRHIADLTKTNQAEKNAAGQKMNVVPGSQRTSHVNIFRHSWISTLMSL